ncbi:MAG: flagellar motor protein MotB [Pseudomonadota bacterium]
MAKQQTILIKKIEDDGHDDHHGGGWKVAYADFMTAMMAFFLLLWILAASDEEALRGLADYFTPSLSEAGGKGQGFLAGQVLAEDGILSGTDGPSSETQLPSFGQENPLAVFDSRIRYDMEFDPAAPAQAAGENADEDGFPGASATEDAADGFSGAAGQSEQSAMDFEDMAEVSLAELIEAEAERREELEEIGEQIVARLAAEPRLADLENNLTFEITPAGLEIQLVDGDGKSMFEIGSAVIEGRTKTLLATVAQSIADKTWPLAISGHTDALPYADGVDYSNWELSADRANATRRELISVGVDPGRINRVSAYAETDPIEGIAPDAPENRRIAILLQYPSSLPASALGLGAELGPQ